MKTENKTNYIVEGKSKSLRFADKINKNLYKLAGGREARIISNEDGTVDVKEKKYKLQSCAAKIKAIVLFLLTMPLLIITMPMKLASGENKEMAKQFAQIKLDRENLQQRLVSDKEHEFLKAQEELRRRAAELDQRERAIRLLDSPVKGQSMQAENKESLHIIMPESLYNPPIQQEAEKAEAVAENWLFQTATDLTNGATELAQNAVNGAKDLATRAAKNVGDNAVVKGVQEAWNGMTWENAKKVWNGVTWENAKGLVGYGPKKGEEAEQQNEWANLEPLLADLESPMPAKKAAEPKTWFSQKAIDLANEAKDAAQGAWNNAKSLAGYGPKTEATAKKADQVVVTDMMPKFYPVETPMPVGPTSMWPTVFNPIPATTVQMPNGMKTAFYPDGTPMPLQDRAAEIDGMIAEANRSEEKKKQEAEKTEVVAQQNWLSAKFQGLSKSVKSLGSRSVTKEETVPLVLKEEKQEIQMEEIPEEEQLPPDPVLDELEKGLDEIISEEKKLKKASEEADAEFPVADLKDLLGDAQLAPLQVTPENVGEKEEVPVRFVEEKKEGIKAQAQKKAADLWNNVSETWTSWASRKQEPKKVTLTETAPLVNADEDDDTYINPPYAVDLEYGNL